MTAILFDTLRLSRTLRDKGHFTPEQAETLAEALGDAAQGDLPTKADLAAQELVLKKEIAELKAEFNADIAELRTELKTEIAGVRTELTAEIAGVRTDVAEVKSDILKWVVGASGFQTAVILGAFVSPAKIFAK